MSMVRPILTDTSPPLAPTVNVRSSGLADTVLDLSRGLQGTLTFLRALLVWLQQQLTGIRAGIFDKMATWEPLVGLRNGTNKEFTIAAGQVRLSLSGTPQAMLFQGGAPISYTDSATPGPLQWTLMDQTFKLGTVPTGSPTDEPLVAFVVIQ